MPQEIRHYLNDRGDYGFSVRLTPAKFGHDDVHFEVFMIVAAYVGEGKDEPIYLVAGHECDTQEYFDMDRASWHTTNIEESSPVITGRMDVDGWVEMQTKDLYFIDAGQYDKYAKMIRRIHEFHDEISDFLAKHDWRSQQEGRQ